jgi:hypothetical protein
MTTSELKDRAKELRGQSDEITVLSTGVRVKLHPVSSALIEDLKAVIPYPEVPVVHIEDKDRDEENPNDPTYLAQVEETNRKRGDAALAGLLEFGVELIDGLPEDDTWIKKLNRLAKKRQLDLSGFDLNDEFDKEFLYKRYVAVAGDDLRMIAPLHGLNPLGVARARATFLGNEIRDADRGLPAERDDTDGDTNV